MIKKNLRYFFEAALISFAAALLFLLPDDCFAGTGPTPGRSLYNNIMLVVNFGILVFFFVKFAKRPLIDFLNNERGKVEDKMNKMENQFKEVKAETDAEAAKIKNIEQHIQKMRENVMEMGKKAKQKIIEQAKTTADLMIEDAQAYAGYQIARAKKALSDQMVDLAVDIVEERLSRKISENDNEKLVSQFVTSLENSKDILK